MKCSEVIDFRTRNSCLDLWIDSDPQLLNHFQLHCGMEESFAFMHCYL